MRLEGWQQRTEPVAILRDARKGALLRMRSEPAESSVSIQRRRRLDLHACFGGDFSSARILSASAGVAGL